MSTSTVFLDLDGVLADFVAEAMVMHGRRREERDQVNTYNVWDWLGETETSFWSLLTKKHFWSNLDPTAEMFDIVRLAEEYAGGPEHVCLLTTPYASPGSHAGKWEWIRDYLPAYTKRYLMGRPKHVCARDNLLIDDSDMNVAEWKAAGGWAILLPRPWNQRRDLSGRVVETLAEDLRRLALLRAYHND